MKKIMAVLLVLVMTLGVVGCSKAEVGYMGTLKEAVSMDQATFEQTITMTIDQEMLEDTGLEFLGNYVELEIKGNSDLNKGAMDMRVRYRLNQGDAFQPLTHLVLANDKLMVSTKDIWAALVKHNDQLKWPPEFVREITTYLADKPYVCRDLSDYYTEALISYSQEGVANWQSIADVFFKNHAQFSTGLVSEKDGGYLLTMNSKNLLDLVDNWLAYAQNNPNQSRNLYNELDKLFNGLSYATPITSEAEWSAFLAELVAEWEEYLKPELMKIALSSNDGYESAIKMTGAAGARVYTTKTTLMVEEIGLSVNANGKITQGAATITVPTTFIDEEDFEWDIEESVERHTAYNYSTIDLDKDWNSVEIHTTFGGNDTSYTRHVDIVNINSYNYICAEDLNYLMPDAEATWSDDKTEVLLCKNGVTTKIDHIMVDGDAYVKIADLSKAGYKVEVVKEPKLMIVITPGK